MLLLVAPVVMGQVGGHAQGVLVWAQLAQDVAVSFMLAAFFARSLAGADFAVPPASTLRSDRQMASAADSVLGAMETALKEYQTVDKFDARQFLIRPKKTPDEEKNRAAKAHFIAKLNVLIALHKLPEGDTHVALNDLTDKVAKLGREHSGFLNCKTFGQIPTASKGALMQKSAPSLQLTDAIISRLDKEDPMAIGNLFHFVFGVPDTVPLPAVLQELVVLQRTPQARQRHLPAHVAPDGDPRQLHRFESMHHDRQAGVAFEGLVPEGAGPQRQDVGQQQEHHCAGGRRQVQEAAHGRECADLLRPGLGDDGPRQ